MAVTLQAGSPVFDSKNQTVGDPTVTTLTQSFTVATGTDRMLLACVGIEDGAGSATITGVTFGGVALTEHAEVIHASWGTSGMWYLLNPSVSTGDVVVTLSGADHVGVLIYCLDGVHQTTPFGTAELSSTTVSGTSSTETVGSVVSGDLVIDTMTLDSTGHSAAVGADQTQRVNSPIGTGSDFLGSTQLGSAGGVMSWTWTGSTDFTHIATVVRQSAGAAAPGPIFPSRRSIKALQRR